MKYHVNPETGKVSQCRAKVKCPFGGESGKENHFPTKAEAEKASELQMSSQHGFASVKKTGGTPAFKKKLSYIKQGLTAAGVSTRNLPEVSTEAELVKKWFNGDRNKYELVAHIGDPDAELNEDTRKAIGSLFKRGAAVNLVGNMDSLGSGKGKRADGKISDVDFIEDLDFESLSPDAIAKGDLRPF